MKDRAVKIINDDTGKTVIIPINELSTGLFVELEQVEERTGKVVTGIILEVEKIKNGKPHNLGFTF